jgi:putative transcription factor
VASCEMCGAPGPLFRTDIEGSILSVCKDCAKYGKVISAVKEPVKVRPKKEAARPVVVEKKAELIQVIVEDYAARIKQAREKMGLKQEELAKALAEKEAIIHKLESGKFEPPITLARKLENKLRIKLVEQHEEKHETLGKTMDSGRTIGDVLSMRK